MFGYVSYYTYDEVNRMEKVWRDQRGCAYYTYDENGNVTKKAVLSQGPLYHTYFTYDALNRPLSIHNRLPDDSALADFDYTYDAAGRMTNWVREDGRRCPRFPRFLSLG